MVLSSPIILLACGLGVVLAGPFELISARAVSPDFTCGLTGVGGSANGYTCPAASPCCSINGFCGSTNEYCLTTVNCQPGYGTCRAPQLGTTTPDQTCGITGAGTAGYNCSSATPCCSLNGWCGNTAAYCGTGCQSKFGNCTATGGGGSTGGGTSTNGRCGPNLGTCASNQCCSLEGFCGTGINFCSAPDCQFNFGPACDANKTPVGTNTSSIPRTKIGTALYGSGGIYDCTRKGDMALTFDDGPAIYTSHILDLLDQYNAKATFFITGNNNGKGQIDDPSLQWPALIRRMYAAGHQIASHTWSHADLSKITSAQRKNEMYKLEMAVRNILGFIPTYMRPPFSSCTTASGCPADLAALGYHITYFNLDTSDYLNDSPELIQKSKTIFDQSLAGKNPASSEFLVIGHDIHNQTSQVLVEYMLKGLTAKGYKPVTVGTCLGDPVANWYRTDTSSTLGTKRSLIET